jgi:hypothetical protein
VNFASDDVVESAEVLEIFHERGFVQEGHTFLPGPVSIVRPGASVCLSVVHPQRGPDECVWTENQGQEGTSKFPCLEVVSFQLMGLDGSTVERSINVDFRRRIGRLYDRFE